MSPPSVTVTVTGSGVATGSVAGGGAATVSATTGVEVTTPPVIFWIYATK